MQKGANMRERDLGSPGLFRVLVLVVVGVVFFLLYQMCLRHTAGVFTYALDDPYIHLSIARNFALHGVWGVTPYETASASSSPLWILGLALPIRLLGDNLFWPLLLGVLFSAGSILLIYSRFVRAGILAPLAFLAALAIFLIGPMHLLPFTGMEHCLQILLDLLFGFWLLDTMGRPLAKGDVGRAVVLSTLICLCRYESVFLLVVPVGACLWRREWKLAGALALGPIIGIGGFGLCSMLAGMPFIPNSIMLKGNVPHTSALEFLGSLVHRTWLYLHFASFAVWDLFVVAVLFGLGLRFSRLNKESKGLQVWIWTLLVTCVLHAGFANVGFFYRYEEYLIVSLATVVVLAFKQLIGLRWQGDETSVSVPMWIVGIVGVTALQGVLYFFFWFYQLNFNLLIFLYFIGLVLLAAMTRPPLTRGRFVRVLLAAWFPALLLVMVHDRGKAGMDDTPKASADIYMQQTQMARFLARYYPKGRVAVNDIGAVTYFTQVHLLDLVGLGSDSVRRLRMAHRFTTETAAAEIGRFDPDVIIVYPDWFTEKEALPSSLIPVGSWTIPPVTSAGSPMVVFYATTPDKARLIKSQLWDFRPELPRAVKVQL